MPQYHAAGQVAQAVSARVGDVVLAVGAHSVYENSPFQPNSDVLESLVANYKSIPAHTNYPVAATHPGIVAPSVGIKWTTKFDSAPNAVSISLQGSNVDSDGSYSTIDTSTNTSGESRTVSAQTYKFYRILVNSVTSGSKFGVTIQPTAE